jgi:hypothetical protein
MNIMDHTIEISRGTVVGIGKIRIPKTKEYNYDIPMLSFLVIKEKDESFVSICIQLQLDGYATTEDIAIVNMIDHIKHFLKVNFTKLPIDEVWSKLKDLYHIDNNVIELWNAYHDIQLNLAAKRISIDNIHDIIGYINLLDNNKTELPNYYNDWNNKMKCVTEWNFYQEHYDEINEKYCGKDILILGNKVIGVYDDPRTTTYSELLENIPYSLEVHIPDKNLYIPPIVTTTEEDGINSLEKYSLIIDASQWRKAYKVNEQNE